MMLPRSARLLAVIVFGISTIAAAAENKPTLTLTGRTVVVSNVTPGAGVAIFALALDPDGFESTVLRWASVVTDAGRSGSVTFDAGKPIPRKSIWAAVDLTNGQYALAAPAGSPLRRRPWPAKPFHAGAGGTLDLFRIDAPFTDALYVQPQRGAWVLRAHDGDTADADGKPDGLTTARLSSARALGAAADPPQLVPGGVLIAIDLYHLDVAAIRLDAAALREVW